MGQIVLEAVARAELLSGVVQDRRFLGPEAGHRPAGVEQAEGLDAAFPSQQATDLGVIGLDDHREHHAGRPLIAGVVSQRNHDRVLPLAGITEQVHPEQRGDLSLGATPA